MSKKHLWEIEHSYYCSQSWEITQLYKSWGDFIGEYGDADIDYNLIFRFDWEEEDEYDGDDYYRNGKLSLCIMQQRKGRYISVFVDVCRADEEKVIKYLSPYWEYMKSLWEGVSNE